MKSPQQKKLEVAAYIVISCLAVPSYILSLQVDPNSVFRDFLINISATLAGTGLLFFLLNRFFGLGGDPQEVIRENKTKDFFQVEFPAELQKHFHTATEVWLGGSSLNRTIPTYQSLIEEKIKQGLKVNILLIDPNGVATEQVAKRLWIQDSLDVRAATNMSLSRLSKLIEQGFPGIIEIRTIDYPINFAYFAFDINTAAGSMFLAYYAFKQRRSVPKFMLTTKDGEWYDSFKNEILALWQESTPYVQKLDAMIEQKRSNRKKI